MSEYFHDTDAETYEYVGMKYLEASMEESMYDIHVKLQNMLQIIQEQGRQIQYLTTAIEKLTPVNHCSSSSSGKKSIST